MLARFEQLMEQAVEGSLRRVFPMPLQPVQIAKAAARTMEQSQVIGVRGAEVPNHYELHLAKDDLERFGEYARALRDQVRTYLLGYAGERDLRPVAELQVELIADREVRPGGVRVRARFANLAPAVQRDVEAAVEGTRRLRLAELAAARTAPPRGRPHQLWLADDAGMRFGLEPPAGIVRIGRATDNDVVIDSQHISRYHAQLRWVASSWLVYDLGSTNGTWVDERRLAANEACAVEAGSRLRLGDHELRAAPR